MANQLNSLTVQQLEKAIAIRQQIDRLETELESLGNGRPVIAGRRGMSVEGRKRVAAAQRARWAGVKNGAAPKAVKKKRTMSPAARAKIAAAQRERWARINAAK